ncbi:hypothetical protein MGYG_08148 [Nannizzia gypsea CBS 118893]|uniref:Uncharacterized protein n=1 Tax=Arthroderma gypseum (strain ATCC MYA-4604 / CBS 118893) TaxID=535722 RepID=E4V562_ARTGP|nr:hypothetical protein MGYG_08148 [Nannizzia gypsea CBS 118893]EFR05136.1 hypothetical protein MGYG_08148 [Nannizzia gypsea CBS 118893]
MDPQMAGNNTAPSQVNAPLPSSMTADSSIIKSEPVEDLQMADSSNSVNWNDERQLVNALCTLQQMHSRINQLRDLLPGRLLGPLKPVINQPPGCEKYQKSPQELCQELSQSVPNCISEIEGFKASWNSAEMTEILSRVDVKLKDRNGQYPYMNTMWECDYEEVLASLDREEKEMEEMKSRQQDALERKKLESTAGVWKEIIESFKAKNIPGISLQTVASGDDKMFSMDIQSISITFHVHMSHGVPGDDSGMWHVRTGHQQSQSKLASDILGCIQSRQRQWDLQYLLDMLSSYTDIKRSPCVSCKKMISSSAQLPIVRKPKTVTTPNGDSKAAWEPFHPQCV